MDILFIIFLLPVLAIAGTILLTLAVEYPIVYFTRITRSKSYIVAVNALTNVILNATIVIICLISINEAQSKITYRVNIWTFFAEILLIPVTEAILYFKVSKESSAKVLLITYLANFISFLVGLIVVGLFMGEGFHGIRDFFMSVFGRGLSVWNMYY